LRLVRNPSGFSERFPTSGDDIIAVLLIAVLVGVAVRISKEEIEHIASLARLSLTEKEKELFGSQLSSILDYMEKLNELDTRNVEPTSHVLPLSNVMRDDVPGPSIAREDALMNAPDHTEKFFRVPKIIE